METAVRRSRASKPKVRTGCITCKIRRVKCDEGKPACHRCLSTGRKCDGYIQPAPRAPHELRQCTSIITTQESRALEFFFKTSSTTFAGFLERSFWKRSVLQFSLSEPCIRQALAALGTIHECEGGLLGSVYQSRDPRLSEQLYNRAIQLTVQKAAAGNAAVPIVVTASILFTCYEFLRRNSAAAAGHIASGINILRGWRHSNQPLQRNAWNTGYRSFEAQFIETELAPVLTLFNLNVSEFGPFPRSRLILNAVEGGRPTLPARFETLREARGALVDLVTATTELFQSLDYGVECGKPSNELIATASTDLQVKFELWVTKFRNLVQCGEPTWNKEEQSAAKVVKIMQLGAEMALAAYLFSSECEWDARRAGYEEIIQLAEALVNDPAHYPTEFSKALSLDLGLIYPLHAVAWKCRYPDLRRQGLALLLRIARREWLLDARQYHAIFSRIMEIEEQALGELYGSNEAQTILPLEYARIHDFFCLPQPTLLAEKPQYTVTFLSKPYGLDGPWHYMTENIELPTLGAGDIAPSNLISTKRWASPDATDPATANMLKNTVFGKLGTFAGLKPGTT
ncbi:hypothetical protein BJY04DRAFT_223004 [Aspergillus karnatakaensis]|uniref:Zn(II)2Cys6 transcription factor domain-containing protein n=1 Tax=Aspergillus karnatakaensis TaxID=1810916 RepID=UPI003CCCCA1A